MNADTLLTTDYRRPENALPVLERIKHTRLEGAIVEHEVEQVLLPAFIQEGWRPVEAMVLRRFSRRDNTHEFDVLAMGDDDGVMAVLLDALRKSGLPVRRLQVTEGELLLLDDPHGEPLDEPQTVPPGAVMPHASGAQLTDPTAISSDRTLATFWGFAAHLQERAGRLVREFVIKDYFIGPYSSGLWDLDRFLISPDGRVVYLETKHKFPIPRSLRFGMNKGEVEQALLLAKAGIHPWHVVLVKPRWDKTLSSMYLFFDRRARECALWIAADLSAPNAFIDGTGGFASAETSIYGRQAVRYVELALEAFSLLGRNSEPASTLSQRLVGLVDQRESLPRVTPDMLENARL